MASLCCRLIGVVIALFAIISNHQSSFAAPLGLPGTVYSYSLESTNGRPEESVKKGTIVTSAEFCIGPVANEKGKELQWFEIRFTRQDGRSYSALLLIDGWPSGNRVPYVSRYLWHEPTWPDYLEYINENTRKPQLPRFSIWRCGWPQSANGRSPASFKNALDAIQLHGWEFKLSGRTTGNVEIPQSTLIELNPDVLVGLTGVHRDAEGRHTDSLGKTDYTFIDPPKDDELRADIESGINFCYMQHDTPWIWRTGCFVSQMYIPPIDWPANLYRSNYWGRAYHSDEPAVYNAVEFNGKPELAGKVTPAEVARGLEKLTIDKLNRNDQNFGNRILGVFVDRVFGKGSLDIVERDYPVWEAYWETSWYHLAPEGSASGVVDEDIYPESMIASYNAALDIQIPLSIENACAIRAAIGRGAGRNFDKDWGTAIYAYGKGALNPLIDLASLKYMYDAGATYFWHWFGWPGASLAVVPYPYKRAYAAGMKQFVQENPNRDMKSLLHAADTCIVLPYGFTFSSGPLHRVNWLHLKRTTDSGSTYRQVLKNAGLEIERCIRNGVIFDIAIDEPRFKPNGYRELIYCREDGTVKIVCRGQKEKMLAQAPVPARPDLGTLWTVSIVTAQPPSSAPCTVKLKAETKPGIGELALGTQNEKAVWWEVYTPDNGYQDLFGEEVSFEAAKPGVYEIRAAVVDCFGRPTYASTTIEVKA